LEDNSVGLVFSIAETIVLLRKRRVVLPKVLNPESRRNTMCDDMKGRLVLLASVSTLLFVLTMTASAQTRTVGVHVGNTFRNSYVAYWSSNDPDATIPPAALEINNTEWLEIVITAVSGTNVTAETTSHYRNGTEASGGGWVDVNTGEGLNATLSLISKNLVTGDAIYGSHYADWFINETVPMTYENSVRDTNHINFTLPGPHGSYIENYYWDKETGVSTCYSVRDLNQTGEYTTSSSLELRLVYSSIWVVPEFSSWTPTLLILITFTSATIIVARQRARSRTLRVRP
jgi:hypothetical protein